MRKKIVYALLIVLIMIALIYLFIIDKQQNSYNGSVTSAKSIKSLNKFLYKQNKNFVTLSIMIDDEMLREIEESMKHSPNIIFHAPDPNNKERKILYVIKTREDGRKEFILDRENRKLEGIFKIHTQVTPKGETIINLIAIPAEEYTENQ